ncbi:ABC transporter ATP-binding protein [Paracoccaceae bacterium GXU_MW_L88]
MIEFRNVSKSFWTGKRRKIILNNASFSVHLGQSLGILAPNGTGKTTLINMMAGIEKPDEGQILRTSRISFPLGFMGGVSNKLSATENCRYIARIYGMDPDYVEAFCRYLCDLQEYFDQPLSKYSSGMRSRFTFSLLLALDFDIYLIDEGMPGTTDVAFNQRAGSILQDRLRHSTVVIVSHSPQIIAQYCQRAAVLRDGHLYMFDTLDEARLLYDFEGSS